MGFMDLSISVVLPTRNGERTIREAINSVLEQTDVSGGVELIVVDDGSTDSTPDILRSYGSALTSIFQEHRGVCATVNHGVRRSRSKYIAFLHDDDYFQPGKLREAALALDNNPKAILAFSDYIIVNSETSEQIEIVKFDHPPELEEMLRKWDCIGPACNVTVRKEVFIACGGFDERLRWGEDVNLWLRLREHGAFVYIPKPLSVYRKRESVVSEEVRYPPAFKAEFERVTREQFGRRAEPLIAHMRNQRAAMLLALALNQIDQMQALEAMHTFTELIRYRPLYLFRNMNLSRLAKQRNILRFFSSVKMLSGYARQNKLRGRRFL